MNKLRKRILITFFTLIFITGLGAAVWSYRKAIAEDAHDTEIESVDMATRQPNFTNIDYIIENSNDSTLVPDANGYDESEFHIVEISSGSPSFLRYFSVVDVTDPNSSTADTDDDYASFRTLVLTNHRSNNQPNAMKEKKIKYASFDTKTLNQNLNGEISQLEAALRYADFIYVSIDPASKYDNNSNTDLPSNVTTWLNSQIKTSRKPCIIDSPTKTYNSENGSLTTFKALCKILFETGSSYNSFVWGKDATGTTYTPAQLFDRTSGSTFMPINGNLQKKNWDYVYDTDGTYHYHSLDGTEELRVAKVLSIHSSSDNTTPLMDTLKQGTPVSITVSDGAVNDIKIASETDGTLIKDANDRQAYVGTFKTTDAYLLGDDTTHIDFWSAYKTYSAFPDYVVFDDISYDKSNPALSADKLSQYDLIILEDSLSGVQVSDGSGADHKNDYMTFVSLMYANQHIVYGNTMIPDGNNNNGQISYDAINFTKLYNLLVDGNDNSRLPYVLVSCRKEMNEFYAAKDAITSTENPIANIINKGAYRPSSSSGDENADKFRVLEIQPAYPVDLALSEQIAAAGIAPNAETGAYGNVLIGNQSGKYNYYFDLDNIKNQKGEDFAADEIKIGTTSLAALKSPGGGFSATAKSTLLNNKNDLVSYYAWELTPAKVLHILEQTKAFADYGPEKIEIVHMSATEFQSSRVSLKDRYDLIYIGGDDSGFKDTAYFRANPSGVEHNGSSQVAANLGASNATYYTMYFHNGDLYEYLNIISEGYVDNGYGIIYGNDLTHDKLEELQEYVNSGMPVVISDRLTGAFKDVYKNDASNDKYKQHVLDPDSNMYKFLKSYYDPAKNGIGTGTKDNILYGFNSLDTVMIENSTRAGDKYSEKAINGVTVFGGAEVTNTNNEKYTSSSAVNESDIVNLINTSNVRPKFVLKPKQQQYDGRSIQSMRDTTLTSRTITFAWDMITPKDGANIEMLLYIDDNVDSRYAEGDSSEAGEIFHRVPASEGKMAYTLPDDMSGAINVQVKARNTVTGAESSIKHIMYKIGNDGDKEHIDILQILPKTMYTKSGTDTNITLYFCTECQTSGHCFNGNHYAQHAKYTADVAKGKYGIDGYDEAIGVNTDGIKNAGLAQPTVQNGIIRRDPDTKVTSGDNTYSYKGNLLGVHDHRFGIYDYNSGDISVEQHGLDDYTHNLADEIEDDYDFSLNIMSTEEFDNIINDVETMYKSSSSITGLRDQYENQRAKYEAFYKEMKMLISEPVSYVPSALYDLRRRVSNITGGGTGDVATLRADIRNVYTSCGITEPAGAASMDPSDLLNDLNSKLGITFAGYDEFSSYLDEYELTITDHINFEREMIELGSSIDDLRKYSKAEQDINGYCNKLIDYMNNGGDLSGGIRSGSTGPNYPHLIAELTYMQTHQCYYDFYSLTASETGKGTQLSGDSANYTVEFGKYYAPWRDAMIFQKYFYDKYIEAKIKSAVDDSGDVVLKDVFSIIIIGPANHFGFDDLAPKSTKCIKRYSDDEGKVLLYHDTIDGVSFGRSGTQKFSEQITKDLRETFGLDARHLIRGVSDADKIASDKTYTLSFGKTTDTLNTIATSKTITSEYNISVDPLPSGTRTYVYICAAQPQVQSGVWVNGAEGNKQYASILSLSDYRTALIGTYDGNVTGISGTLRLDGNGKLENSNVTTSTGSGMSFDGTFDLSKKDNNTNTYGTPSEKYYIVVCHSNSTNNAVVLSDTNSNNYFLKPDYAEVFEISSGDSFSSFRGVTNITFAATTRNGNISGVTGSDDADKQVVQVVFRGSDVTSVLGSSVKLSGNGESYTATVEPATYNGNSVGMATFYVDNWTVRGGSAVQFTTTDTTKYPTDKYFLSKLATDGTYQVSFNGTAKTPVTTAITQRATSGSGSNTGYNNNLMNRNMYRFGLYDSAAEDYISTTMTRQDCMVEFKATNSAKRQVDDKVGNNNRGLVTEYPFYIPNDFIVTPTHPQAFDLDVEDDAMIPYFSFVAGSDGTMSQMHAADPYNATENYFVYQYNSVTYCGAGHMSVTGLGTNNREERMLYINIIVNSLHKSVKGTSVKLYDENATNDKIADGTANAIIKPDGLGNYTLEVKDSNVTPAFSVKATLDGGETITRVRAWYDLDLESETVNHPFEPDSTTTTYDHRLFYDTNGGEYDINGDGTKENVPTATAAELAAFTVAPVNINTDAKFRVGDMKLKQEYFDAYDGMHTYIVVCVTSQKGNKTVNTYRKIRINLKPYMFDLT